jgi:hypothetical protein
MPFSVWRRGLRTLENLRHANEAGDGAGSIVFLTLLRKGPCYPQDSTMSNTIKQKNPRNSKGPADIWRNSTAQATPLSAHRMAAKVYIDKLNLTGEQRSQISRLYDQNVIEDFTYFPDNEHEQIAAAALLAAHHLDFDARECLASRWSIKWGVNSGKGSAADRRVLYQW